MGNICNTHGKIRNAFEILVEGENIKKLLIRTFSVLRNLASTDSM
jgi:hypothetical protein